MIKIRRACPQYGKQALRFTSGSFAFRHFQLHYIDNGFLFASGTEKRKIKHRCIAVHFGSGFGIADWAANPTGILLFFTHNITSRDAFALRSDRLANRQPF